MGNLSRASAAAISEASVRVAAKVNLHLRVGPARQDGFHPLLTWMTTVGLFDTLHVALARGGRSADAGGRRATVTLHVGAGGRRADAKGGRVGPAADAGGEEPAPGRDRDANIASTAAPAPRPMGVPTDDRNLVVRAAHAWWIAAAATGHAEPPPVISLTLNKHVPIGAGLGGGSADAAATLLTLNRLAPAAGLPVASDAALAAAAAPLGSDVPFFLVGPSSICTGRGEHVQPVPPPAIARWAVLILPNIHMPTPAVYKQFDTMELGRSADIKHSPDWSAWATLPSVDLLERLVNDLEPPAFALRPDLASLRLQCEQSIDRTIRMSGSGSTLFTLFDDEAQARDAAQQIAAECRTDAVATRLCSTV